MPDETPTPEPAPAPAGSASPPTPKAAKPRAPRKAAEGSGKPAPKATATSSSKAENAHPDTPAEKPAAPIRRKGASPQPRSPAAPPKPAAPAPPPGTVVDASGLVLGRAASLIAQRLLKGEQIVVVHAERSVITGARARVIDFYTANRARGSKRTGPHYPRYPDRIFRRTVRGMLPHLKTRGKIAFDRLEVFIGCPEGFKAARPEWVQAAAARPSVRPLITLGEVSRLLGARV